jgi:transposase-like protein
MLARGYVHCISTRSVDDLVQAMGCSGVSKSQVSRLCADIDECVQASCIGRSKASGPMCGWTQRT